MPTAYILVGVPCSGKSKWANEQKAKFPAVEVLSFDEMVNDIAKQKGLSYLEAYNSFAKEAYANYITSFKKAIEANKDIIIDKTNISVASRARTLARIPEGYHKYCVNFMTPGVSEAEYAFRAEKRKDKQLNPGTVHKFFIAYQPPTFKEGFDVIVAV